MPVCKIKQNILCKMFISSLFFLIAGCGVGAIIGGSIQTFTGTETIILGEPKENIFDTITEVGKKMDLSVSGIDKVNQLISLSSGFATTGSMITGKQSSTTIAIVLADAGKKLNVTMQVMGNFGFGTKENADKIFNEFKEKLLSEIK